MTLLGRAHSESYRGIHLRLFLWKLILITQTPMYCYKQINSNKKSLFTFVTSDKIHYTNNTLRGTTTKVKLIKLDDLIKNNKKIEK